MTLEIIAKYTHFLAIFAIVGSLVSEHLLLKSAMTRSELKRLARIDGVYGFASIILLVAGFTLWFGVGKPASYYNHNWIFLMKIGLFVVIGLLSIRPTLFFLRNRKGMEDEIVHIPSTIKMLVRVELAILFCLPLLATMMAKGLGYFGS